MILIFSSHCNQSPQVCREVERAVHRQVPILPFRIEDVLPARSLEYFLSTQHWLDAFPPPCAPHYSRLCNRVLALLNGTSTGLTGTHEIPRAINTVVSLDLQELESFERRLAYHVGPVARHLVRRAASRATSREELLVLLADEVESASGRQQFIEACRRH